MSLSRELLKLSKGETLGYAIGIVTDDSPFTVQINGDTVDIINPPLLGGIPDIGTPVFVLRPGPAMAVIGSIGTTGPPGPSGGTRETSIVSNATWSPDADTTDIFTVTAQAVNATTINNPAGTPVTGQKLIFRIKDNGTTRTLAWTGSEWRSGADLPLPANTIASATLYLGFIYNATDSKWDLIAGIGNL